MNKQNNIFKIHYLTLVYFLIIIFSGLLHQYLIVYLLILFHELCHFFMARCFDFRIYNITLMPFGAKLNIIDYGSYHVLEELLVALSGPLSHIIIFAFLKFLGDKSISPILFDYAIKINGLLMIFNLLPIYPLDGHQVLIILLSFIFPYRCTLFLSGIISTILLIFLIITKATISYLIICVFLISEQIMYFKNYSKQYYHMLLLRDKYVIYSHLKINKGYSLYRPYFNVYVKNKKMVVEKIIKK